MGCHAAAGRGAAAWATAAAVVVLLSLAASGHALTFSVLAHREECFFETVPAGIDLGVVFQVTAGGMLDIDIRIESPSGRIIHQGSREKEGKYFFVSDQEGAYRFCFSNRMSTITPKTVMADFKVGHAAPEGAGDNFVDETLSPAIMQLADGISSIAAEEKYMRQREMVHRDTTESTNARVLWWSILETGSLVAMSAFQIVYLRRMFEVRRNV